MIGFIFSSNSNQLHPTPVIASLPQAGVAISFFWRLFRRPAKNGTPRDDRLGNRSLSVRILSLSMLILIFLGTLGAGSMKLGSDEIELVGRVYVMGNEPFTVVALKLDDGDVYALLGDHDKELRGLQGKRLSVAGKPSEEKPRGAKAIIVKSFKVLDQR